MVAYLAGKVVPAGLGLLLIPLLVRHMSAADYAYLGQALAAVNALIGLASGWFNQAQLRFVTRATPTPATERARQWAIGLNALLGGAGLALWGLASGRQHIVAECGLYLAMLLGLAVTTRAVATQRAGRFALLELARMVVMFAVLWGLIVSSPVFGPTQALLGYGLGFACVLLTWRPAGPRPEVSSAQVRATLAQWWRFGWPAGVWIGLTSLIQLADRVVIQSQAGDAVAASYTALAELFFRGVSLVMFPLILTVHPEAVRLWQQGEVAAVRRLCRRALGLQAAGGGVALLGCTLGAPWIAALMGLRLPPDATVAVACLVASAVVWQMALVAHKPFELTERTRGMLLALLPAALAYGLVLWLARSHWQWLCSAQLVAGLVYLAACRWLAPGLDPQAPAA